VAPFAGTVTARSVERGALVSAGNGTPLFKVAALDPVRVFIQAPQDVAPSIRAGAAAKVTVREFPGRIFEGKVARAAGALDPTTRTMTTEVRVPNPKGELLPGVYAQVALALPVPHKTYEIPATALMNDAAGLRVAIVDVTGAIRLVPVTIERDTGATFLIASGLDGTERVVKLAGPELTDGRKVDVAPGP
jgi:RND family efflux transporter MFP subunit